MKTLLAPLPVIDLLVLTAVIAFAGTIGTAHYHHHLQQQAAAQQPAGLSQLASR
jgi:hypothetical protein